MDMPAKEEGGIRRQDQSTQKVMKRRSEEQLEQRRYLTPKREEKGVSRGDFRKHGKGCVAHQAPSDAIDGVSIDGQIEIGRHLLCQIESAERLMETYSKSKRDQ